MKTSESSIFTNILILCLKAFPHKQGNESQARDENLSDKGFISPIYKELLELSKKDKPIKTDKSKQVLHRGR